MVSAAHYRRLAARARAHGDRHSALIYQRQAEEAEAPAPESEEEEASRARVMAALAAMDGVETEADMDEARQMLNAIRNMKNKEIIALMRDEEAPG